MTTPASPTPAASLQSDVVAAMKAGEKDRLSTLRMLLAAVKNEQIERGEDLDQDAFQAVVRRQIKQRRDSAEQFRKGGRDESAAHEEAEIVVLETYLPAQVSEDELRAAIEEFVAAEGLEGMKGMGPVMKTMGARFGATAEGAVISRIARSVLTGG